MFVGHLAVALAAKSKVPRVPLWAFVSAAYGLDLAWPLLLLVGAERVLVDPGNTAFTHLAFVSYPWSHSLAMVLLWGALAGMVGARVFVASRIGWLVGAVVVSHWFLDFVTHRPDLPLWPGGPMVGLGLWQSVPGTILVEGGIFITAVVWYVRAAPPRDRVGPWALWSLVALTGFIWISQPWSPPPPSALAVALVSLSMWVFPIWAHWIDRHRTSSRAA